MPDLAPGVSLVTLARAKAHLRITDADHDDDIGQKSADASGIIVRYLKGQADPTWEAVTNPPPSAVQSAILLMLAQLYEHRGDDESFGAGSRSASTWDAIEHLLVTWRDPAVA